ncbi:uncharacterized protein LOC131234877 [Magnolia sinica]|uniref:uncharacterized protein LOC131234877 n=1 Tax=Magnolia sinica TaxID=86752 RepID=UPI002659AD70|nr:uncharacterized protein LOC131234877 [Magnolia sinica]
MREKVAVVLLLFFLASQMGRGEASAADCNDACSTACVQKDTRLMARCELKCQIKCEPGRGLYFRHSGRRYLVSD